MTTLPPNADDLVSAFVDDQASPDEVAVVEASDVLMARVTDLRTQQQALAVTPPSATRRELHIGAALAEFDRINSQDPTPVAAEIAESAETTPEPPASAQPAEPAGVASLEDARERRRPWRLGLIAAALIATMAIIGALNLGGGTDQVADTAADTMTAMDAAQNESEASAEMGGGGGDVPLVARSTDDRDAAADDAMAETANEAAGEAEEAASDEAAEEAEAEEAPSDADAAFDAADDAASGLMTQPVGAIDLGPVADLEVLVDTARASLSDSRTFTDEMSVSLTCARMIPGGFALDRSAAPMIAVLISPDTSDATTVTADSIVEVYPGATALLLVQVPDCTVIDIVDR